VRRRILVRRRIHVRRRILDEATLSLCVSPSAVHREFEHFLKYTHTHTRTHAHTHTHTHTHIQREFEHTSLHGFRPLDVLNANDGVKPTVVENVNRLQGAVNGILNEQDIQVACCTLTTETRLHRHV